MNAPPIGRTEKKNREQGVDQQNIFYRMVFFLAAITRGLFSRVLGADDAPFGAVMGTRGKTGAGTGATARGAGSSACGATTVALSGSETPQRCARATRERAGAAPRGRSGANSAGQRT